jgi:hypothetical protein
LISIKDMMQAFILEIDVSQCLPVVVAHDLTSVLFFGGPGRRELACRLVTLEKGKHGSVTAITE